MTVEKALQMAQSASVTAKEALDLGKNNSEKIAVVATDLKGHKETCEAQNRATHEKLDFIISFLKTLAKWGGLGLITSLLGIVAYLLLNPGVGLTQ